MLTPARPLPPPTASPRATSSSSSWTPYLSSTSIPSTPPTRSRPAASPPFDPGLLICLLLYAYCVGVYSSRKIAAACERNLAFLTIVGDDRPDFRTISDFRKGHLELFAGLFTQVLRLAAEAGLVRLGNLAFDGSKFLGQASRHKAMSYGYMKKEEARLREEIETLLQQAQDTDAQEDAALGSRRGDELPAELQRREQRLAVIAAAKQRLEEQARVEAQAERQRRAEVEAERQHTGKERRGKEPKPVSDVPDDKAQSHVLLVGGAARCAAQALAGQPDQARVVALPQRLGRRVVASPEVLDQRSHGPRGGHHLFHA